MLKIVAFDMDGTPQEPPKSHTHRGYSQSIRNRLERVKAAVNAPKNDVP